MIYMAPDLYFPSFPHGP